MSAAASAARVPTASAGRYLRQLCSHWSHKFPVEAAPEHGRVTLPLGTVTLAAHPDALDVRLDAAAADQLPRLKAVVASHLDRFAFREAPLAFAWRDGE